MRQKLKAEGSLLVESEFLLFARDVEFSSPSAAAAVIHGGNANGLTAWKDSQGQTLGQLEVI